MQLQNELSKTIPNVKNGLNATADSFYSSQGRQGNAFHDDNQTLLDTLKSTFPNLKTLEMETFLLYHLAKVEKNHHIQAAGCVICFANRFTNDFIDKEKVSELELKAGKAIFDTFI